MLTIYRNIRLRSALVPVLGIYVSAVCNPRFYRESRHLHVLLPVWHLWLFRMGHPTSTASLGYFLQSLPGWVGVTRSVRLLERSKGLAEKAKGEAGLRTLREENWQTLKCSVSEGHGMRLCRAWEEICSDDNGSDPWDKSCDEPACTRNSWANLYPKVTPPGPHNVGALIRDELLESSLGCDNFYQTTLEVSSAVIQHGPLMCPPAQQLVG